MAQYDIRLNPIRETKRDVPYLIEVQSDALDTKRHRVVIPLFRQAALAHVDRVLNPIFQIEGDTLVLMPLDIAAVLETDLGKVVGSLKSESDRVIGALDLLLACY